MSNETISVPRERALLLVNLLAKVSSAAFWLADNSEDDGSEGINCQRDDFDTLSKALDLCDELPELPGNVVRDGWLRAVDELRALLAQPALAVKQYGQDSVTGHSDVEVTISRVTHYDHGPNVAEALARLACRVARFYKLEAPTLANPAEQHQGEPVAQVEVLDSGGQLWIALNAQWLPVGVHSLYARPGVLPAPAAVVLPSRDDSLGTAERDEYANGYRHGWNACLDEVARLNPPQQ